MPDSDGTVHILTFYS